MTRHNLSFRASDQPQPAYVPPPRREPALSRGEAIVVLVVAPVLLWAGIALLVWRVWE